MTRVRFNVDLRAWRSRGRGWQLACLLPFFGVSLARAQSETTPGDTMPPAQSSADAASKDTASDSGASAPSTEAGNDSQSENAQPDAGKRQDPPAVSEAGDQGKASEKSMQSADALRQLVEVKEKVVEAERAKLAPLQKDLLTATKSVSESIAAFSTCRSTAGKSCEVESAIKAAAETKLLVAQQKVDTQSAAVSKEEAVLAAAKSELEDSHGFHHFLGDRLKGARRVRCMTAICWGGSRGNPYKYGVEPLVDLPIGIVWSVGRGALSSYINSNVLNVEFNAGMRVWVLYDKLSFSLYFAKPVGRKGDSIRLPGSSFEHSVDAIHRPFPSFAIGVLGDMLQIGIAYDVLVNGSGTKRDPDFPPNRVLSRSLTFTLGFSTLTAMRNAAGIVAEKSKEAAK